jgi:phosphatidylserine/phosphatidylglycerophosphate/cardiolipin synthase-like enzyme
VPKGKRTPPAVHIHHKFIVIDGDTDAPTIFTGSANLSKNSTNFNDENLLEITGSPALAQTYLAEFMRLYEHYRARAIWNEGTGKTRGAASAFTLKTTRDGWVRDAYKPGTAEALARVTLARAPTT